MRALCLLALSAVPASVEAELVLSRLVVDLPAKGEQRADIEVWNDSDERAYVVSEPSEISDAGLPSEKRVSEVDPERRGLLVSPSRMILEPGQRRLLRVAPIGLRGNRERVYRVTVKPVAGQFSSDASGLKLMIGYDVLVLLRPASSQSGLTASRSGRRITFRNNGNASVELLSGKQCLLANAQCVELPGKRLYAGAQWTQELRSDAPVEYVMVSGGQTLRQSY